MEEKHPVHCDVVHLSDLYMTSHASCSENATKFAVIYVMQSDWHERWFDEFRVRRVFYFVICSSSYIKVWVVSEMFD